LFFGGVSFFQIFYIYQTFGPYLSIKNKYDIMLKSPTKIRKCLLKADKIAHKILSRDKTISRKDFKEYVKQMTDEHLLGLVADG